MSRLLRINILLAVLMSVYSEPRSSTKFKCEKEIGTGRMIGYFSGYVINDRFLNDAKQIQFNTSKEQQCVKKCVRTDLCRTISVIQPIEKKKNITCYLSTSNIFQGYVLHKKGSKIISLGTPACETSPCKNGGLCQPNYTNGKYTCRCLPGSKGNNCEIKLSSYHSSPGPNVTISFDNYHILPVTNKEASFGFAKSSVSQGKVVSVHHAKTPVYMTMANHSRQSLSYENKMLFLVNPIAEPRNLTIGAWIRLDDDHTRGYLSKGDSYSVDLFSTNLLWFTISDKEIKVIITNCKPTEIREENKVTSHCTQDSEKRIMVAVSQRIQKKMWFHIGLFLGDESMGIFMNGKKIVSKKVLSDVSGQCCKKSSIFHLLSNFYANPGLTFFVDEIKIFNDYKTDKFISAWYNKEKRNYILTTA